LNIRRKRQDLILEIINGESIYTQEELLARLRDKGFEVTQATISRDIKELRLVKKAGPQGKSMYSHGNELSSDYFHRYHSIFSDTVLSIDFGMNTCVIKCHAGMAQAACAALDSMRLEGVLGTLAGDDTIFVLCKTTQSAEQLKETIEKMINV
jgi:transcriptional regulator of arginine metabolism